MNRVSSVGCLVWFGLLILITGCVSTSAPSPRYYPSFDYVPPGESEPGHANVTFAVVGAEFESPAPLLKTFASNMAKDFQEVLSARGYTTRGPFGTYDQMTFPDKKNSDLVLTPEVTFDVDSSGVEWKQSFMASVLSAGDSTYYRGEGPVTITGHISIVISESLSNERMWTKSVAITPIAVHLKSENSYIPDAIGLATLLSNEPQFYLNFARALEARYQEIVHKVYTYLDPEEMVIVKQQAQEIRDKKVY